MSALVNKSRETWLHGWPRGNYDVLIGSMACCIGCGKSHGLCTIAIPEGYEHWVDRRPYPDWPFDEASCPICYLADLYMRCKEGTEREWVQIGKDGTPIRDLRGKLPK